MANPKAWQLTAYGRWMKITMIERNIQAKDIAEKLGISKQRISELMYGIRPVNKHRNDIEKLLGATPPADIAS